MKEHSHKSHKHTKGSHSKRHNGSHHTEPEKHREVLKERPCRNDSETRRSEKSHHGSSKSHSKDNKNHSISDHSDRKKSKVSSGAKKEDGNYHRKKHTQSNEESYEELSRKKRKIESELKALDMEEAKEKNSESKKQKKDPSNRHKTRRGEVHIKEEPVSDEERNKDPRDGSRKRRPIKTEPTDRNRHHAPPPADEEQAWGRQSQTSTEKIKEKPNFATSGKLAEDTNTYNGVVIKYNQPSEARKPKRRWRLYPFKGESDLPFIPIHRQSAYLFGRTRSIADIPIDHPSCSKQHAVLQFRLVMYKRDDGSSGKRVRPYIIDLESSNGTFVNNKRVDPRCYVELIEKDVVKFGYSSREYVILHEESKNDDYDDLQESS